LCYIGRCVGSSSNLGVKMVPSKHEVVGLNTDKGHWEERPVIIAHAVPYLNKLLAWSNKIIFYQGFAQGWWLQTCM